MKREGLSAWGVLLRLLAALCVVYGTYNPEGYSYYHWVMRSLMASQPVSTWYDSNALKFLLGVLLLSAWLIFLNATRHSLGILGVTLVMSICGGFIWFLAELDWFTPGNTQAFIHLLLAVIAVVLAAGLSWSHINRRLTGQIDTDDVD